MLYLIGLNHNSAALALREQTALLAEQLPQALTRCAALPAVREVMMLSTCNRTEIIAIADAAEPLLAWLAEWHQLPLAELKPATYCFQGVTAVNHLMRVACGLDSMVLGEPQIFGQLKRAFHLAQEVGCVGKKLNKTLQAVFSVGKQVRTDTQVGASPVSLAYTVIKCAQQIFSDLSACCVVFIGAGEMTQLMARHFYGQGVRQLVIANRSRERADRLAAEVAGQAVAIGDMPAWLEQADIVISATATQLPVLSKAALEQAFKSRKHRQLLIADLAMPRDVEPDVATLADVYLYNLEDLQQIIAQNQDERAEAAKLAEQMVAEAAQRFSAEVDALDAMLSIREFRRKVEQMRDQEIERALNELVQGQAADAVVIRSMRLLVNKILHQPTVQLRRAAQKKQHELITLAKALFEQS